MEFTLRWQSGGAVPDMFVLVGVDVGFLTKGLGGKKSLCLVGVGVGS